MDSDSSEDQFSGNTEDEDIFQGQSDHEQNVESGSSEENSSGDQCSNTESGDDNTSSDSGSYSDIGEAVEELCVSDGDNPSDEGSPGGSERPSGFAGGPGSSSDKEAGPRPEGVPPPDPDPNEDHQLHVQRHSTSANAEESGQVCVPFQSVLDHIRPVGGSKSIDTSHISIHTSDEDALELVGAIRRGDTAAFNTALETKGSSGNTVKEVHVHLMQTNIHNPSALTLGGQVVVNPPTKNKKKKKKAEEIPLPPTQLQKQRCETEKRIEKWTEGMIHTRGTQAVLDKISQGRTLITITGSPGEGKTTTGYLVLKRLHGMGRQVYDVVTPEDYYRAKESKQPVLMINDIFGSLTYDLDKRWKEVLNDILAMNEHKREDEIDSRERKKPRLTVLLICRSSILKEASYHMGRLKDLILNEECVVDLTHGIERATDQERMKIWKYHSSRYDILIDEKIIKDVCQKSLQHGFPHCCRLFASMHAKNKLCDMKAFFSKPLEFLNQTMESMIMDSATGPMLREMLKNNGLLHLEDVDDDEKRFQYSSVVEKLRGTYLSQDDDTVTFHHPSVYDSAAFVVCTKDPLFVIKNCSLSFLNERVRFDGLVHGSSPSHETVTVDGRYITKYLNRLVAEFENGNLSLILQQDSFHDENFTVQFMQRIMPVDKPESDEKGSYSKRVRNLINKKDRVCDNSFLFLSTKSKSDNILRYICNFVELTQQELADAVFGICEHVSLASLRMLDLKYDLKMNMKNMESQTPLLLAATKCSEEMLKLILQKDADISTVDHSGNTALQLICRHGVDGDGDIVKILVDKGADVNIAAPEYPFLPLSIACFEGQTNVVMALLDLGTDVNKPNGFGATPLHEASWMGHVDIVKGLLDRGAKVNKSNGEFYEGKTPLHDACRQGHLNVVNVLLQRGADVNEVSTRDVTPLHDACYNGHADVVRVLVKNGAKVNESNSERYCGKTPLHDACSQGYLEIVEVLLEGGADFNKLNSNGESPLHDACRQGDINIVTLLTKRGADVKSTNIHGVTPLHEACWNGHSDVVKYLLESGAEIDKQNKNGQTPLHDACCQGQFGVVTLLVDGGADVNKSNSEGETPIHGACRQGDLNIVIVLIEKGTDVNNSSRRGATPLHDACWNGHASVVRFLLEKGANINKQNGDVFKNKTPLHDACGQGHLDVVKALLEKGADVNIMDRDGQTPLDIARMKGYDYTLTAF